MPAQAGNNTKNRDIKASLRTITVFSQVLVEPGVKLWGGRPPALHPLAQIVGLFFTANYYGTCHKFIYTG